MFHKVNNVLQRAGQRPPTSVVNLIFVLANHAAVRESPYSNSATFADLFVAFSRCAFRRAGEFSGPLPPYQHFLRLSCPRFSLANVSLP